MTSTSSPRAFADGGDAVLFLQLPVDVRGPAGDDVHDLDVVVFELQRRADAVVGQAHLDPVLLALPRRQIARVRIHVVRDGVHVDLEDVVGGQLRDAAVRTFVTLLEGLGGLRPGLAGQHEPQAVALDVLAPDLGDLLVRHGPRQLASVPLEGLVERVVGLRGEQRDGALRRARRRAYERD